MDEQKKPDYAKAKKAAVIAFFCLAAALAGADILINVINGKPAFTMPSVISIVIDIVILIFGTFSIYRNVANGKKWYK